MKLKPSGGCRIFLAAFVATLASVAQLFAADIAINWANPADIVYGTPLSGTQLNAVFTNADTGAPLQGQSIYSPPAGTYLNAGNQQTLQVTFIPNAGQGVNGSKTTTVFINVAKAPLTATAPSASVAYGTAVANWIAGLNAGQVTYSGFISNGAINDGPNNALQVGPTLSVAAGIGAATAAGTSVPVTFGQKPSGANYAVTTVNGTLSIDEKVLTFSLADKSKLYGQNPLPSDLNIAAGTGGAYDAGNNAGTGLGWENGDENKVQISQVHSVEVGTSVGVYDISVLLAETTLGTLDNYNVQINPGKYTVAKRPLTIAVTPGDQAMTYGANLPTFGADYTIEVGGGSWDITNVPTTRTALETTAGVLSAPVSLVLPSAQAGVANSPYAITTTGGTVFNGNFAITRVNRALTVSKANIDIKASDRTKLTGVPLPGIGTLQIEFPTPAQFKFGQQAADVITPFPVPLLYNTALHPGLGQNSGIDLAAGNYVGAITFDRAKLPAAENYSFTLYYGDLTVTRQLTQMTWTPQATSLTYGEGLDAVKHLNAAKATQVLDPNNSNQPVALDGVITYTAKTGNNAAFAVQPGDHLPAGNWVITATFTPSAADETQYGVDYDPGTFTLNFTVNKKSLKVTANNQTRVFGNYPGGFVNTAVTYDGFATIGGVQETAAALTGANNADLWTSPTVADPTIAGTDVGTYSIIPSGGKSANYAFNYVSGEYKITPAGTVTTWTPEAAGADQAKWVTYGTALASTPNTNAAGPAGMSGTITYDININDPRALTVPGLNVKATFTPSSPNYSASNIIVFINVKRRTANVVPTGLTLTFGDAIPALSGSTDFLDGDGIVTEYTTTAIKGSSVGEYLISAKHNDSLGRKKNYTISLKSGPENRIKINPATLNIETVNRTSAVGQSQVAFTFKLSGLKAEAAVLNGVELTIDPIPGGGDSQFLTAYNNTTITIGNDTYNNNNSDLPASIKALNLLGRVFTAGELPTVSINPAFANGVEKDFTLKTVLDTETDNDPTISVAGDYVLGTNSDATYSVGKATPTINWTNSVLTYGQAIGNNELNATVAEATLNAANKAGTFTYRIGDGNGPAASGAKLDAGNHTLHVTYVPHADNQNAFVTGTKTVTLTVNQAPLDVRIPAINNYVYGDPLPRIQVTGLTFGTVQGNNVVNNFVNGDDASIFEPANGGRQPVVGFKPGNAVQDGGYSVPNSPAQTFFGQSGSAKNYIINHIGNFMGITPRPITVKAADITTTFGNNATLGLEYLNLAPGETSANLASAGFAFMNPQADISGLAPGQYTVFANGAYGPNYIVTHAAGTLIVEKALATIQLGDNITTYDGTPKAVTVTTVPAGLATSVTYDGNAQAPTAAGSYQVVVTVSNPNYQGTINGTLVINGASATVNLADTSQVYDGTAKFATVTTVPAGLPVTTTYNKNPAGATAAGSYELVATVTDPNYSGSAKGVFTVTKTSADISISGTTHVADGNAKQVVVTTTPAGLDNVVTYNGDVTAPSAAGTYAVVVTIADPNHIGTFNGTMEILDAATISLSDLQKPYTGSELTPTVTTNPAGLNVALTYNKSPNAPKAAGSYEVVATIQDALYTGSAKATFRITKTTATVTFDAASLETNWKAPAAAQVTTDPSGLNTVITYNGSTDVPTEPGDYEVVGTVVTSNYSGSATATFSVGKSPQNVSFPAIPNLTISGQPLLLILNATSDSGLAVKYTVTAGSATINGNVLTVAQPGSVVVTAQQLGNERYLAAEEKVRSFQVSGTGVPLGAPQTTASLTDDGDVSLSVSGEPFTTLSVYAADALTGEFKPVVKIGLDENGQGNYNTPVEGAQRFFQVK